MLSVVWINRKSIRNLYISFTIITTKQITTTIKLSWNCKPLQYYKNISCLYWYLL